MTLLAVSWTLSTPNKSNQWNNSVWRKSSYSLKLQCLVEGYTALDEYTTLGCSDQTNYLSVQQQDATMQYSFFFNSNCETNKLITPKLTQICAISKEQRSFSPIFFCCLNSDISVDVLTPHALCPHINRFVTDDAASLYCLPFTSYTLRY